MSLGQTCVLCAVHLLVRPPLCGHLCTIWIWWCGVAVFFAVRADCLGLCLLRGVCQYLWFSGLVAK